MSICGTVPLFSAFIQLYVSCLTVKVLEVGFNETHQRSISPSRPTQYSSQVPTLKREVQSRCFHFSLRFRFLLVFDFNICPLPPDWALCWSLALVHGLPDPFFFLTRCSFFSLTARCQFIHILDKERLKQSTVTFSTPVYQVLLRMELESNYFGLPTPVVHICF